MHSTISKTSEWTLILIVIVCHIGEILACGGCGSTRNYEDACGRLQTRRIQSKRGWWIRYRTIYFMSYSCCSGYDLVGTRCQKQQPELNILEEEELCGGCEDTTISPQPTCVRTVRYNTKKLEEYDCMGPWGARTCYKYVIVSTDIQEHSCCSLYTKHGTDCYKRSPVTTSTTTTTTTTTTTQPPTTTTTRRPTTSRATTTTQAPSSLLQCGIVTPAAQRFIVGGSNAAQCEYPWQVSLRTNVHRCGGVIVSDRWVMTAAHCVTGMSFSKLDVRVGEHRLSSWDTSERTMTSAAIYIHPSYNKHYHGYDIALIKTQDQIKFNNCVQPACLPSSSNDDHVGVRPQIVGWGQTTAGIKNDASRSDILQEASVVIVESRKCSSIIYRISDYERLLCTSDGLGDFDVSSCSGDSGSGMYVLGDSNRWEVIGVAAATSSIPGCAKGLPFAYTKVSYHLDWLKRMTGL